MRTLKTGKKRKKQNSKFKKGEIGAQPSPVEETKYSGNSPRSQPKYTCNNSRGSTHAYTHAYTHTHTTVPPRRGGGDPCS